jgi:hypothetical protein
MAGRRWLGLGASGGREEGRGALDFGKVGAEGGVPREQTAGGGARPRRRRSDGLGGWGNGRRAAQGLGEANCGLGSGEWWQERGPPRRGRASAAAMVGGDARACRSEPDSAREWEGSEEGGRECALRELKGRRGPRAQGDGEGCTTRFGASLPWRFERPSACAPGDGATWRGRETSRRNRECEVAGLAGELGAWPAARRRRTAR